MVVVGLTGGSGAGKGYVCRIFSEYGILSVDADEVYRIVSARGTPCLAELGEYFGQGILTADGELDRRALADIVFKRGAEDKLASLNRIAHKYVIEYCERWIAERESLGDFAVIIDAPQLFESGLDKRCDLVVSVVADRECRIERITERDGISRERAEKRIDSQYDDAFFAANSDYVVESGNGSDVRSAVAAIVERIKLMERGKV